MTGFVLFGAHLNGSDLDPDERKLLAGLTRSAAGAIEHALVEMKIAENATLRAENAVLKEVVTRVPGSISN
jgi:GAF domain-containing protein